MPRLLVSFSTAAVEFHEAQKKISAGLSKSVVAIRRKSAKIIREGVQVENGCTRLDVR